MTKPDWQQVKDLFAEAVEQPLASRREFLEAKCDGDGLLFDEVNSLLTASSEPENLIEKNVINIASKVGVEVSYVERHFGPYRIIREIGSGGMGTVFLAERDDGEFTKRVALKIVRQSVAGQDVINRFKRERQILAGLNHPNIAALYDGGISDKGEPFLAMEYVDGATLIDYANDNDLGVEARLSLFLQICSAVSYAHRNLVIHRDIKPSNILVDRDGVPRLLDFGLAKSFGSDVAETRTELRAFTPAYASPEQINGVVITTASDVYSLGVIFYELLAGTKPLHFEDKSFEEIVQTINTSQPLPPSLIPDQTGTDAPNRRLKGDLDNIALMALRKEPERRYSSVEEFADDIKRHLRARPIVARPNTFGYLTAKFIRRNRIAVVAVGLIIVVLMVGLSFSLWQANVARRETVKAQVINDSLRKMLKSAMPESGSAGKKGVQTTILDVLNETEQSIDNGELSSQPEVKAELRQLIGEAYSIHGKYDLAQHILQTAFDEQAALYGAASPKTFTAELSLATSFLSQAEYGRALEIFDRRLNDLTTEYRANRIEPKLYSAKIQDYAVTCRAVGESSRAESLLRDLVSEADKPQTKIPADSANILLTLILLDEGQFAEARATQSALVSRLRQSVEPDDPVMPQALTLFGSILMENGELEPAAANLIEAEKIYRKLYGPESLATFDNIRLQAQVSYLKGDYNTAKERFDIVLENYKKSASSKYISFATALTYQGLTLQKLGQSKMAEEVLREAVRLREENLPPGHFMTALSKGALGEVLLDEGKTEEAGVYLRESLDRLNASQKVDNARIRVARERLARLENASIGASSRQ